MTLAPSGFLRIGDSDLEYRMIGPAPDAAPTIVMLHEGLGSAALWGDFPRQAAGKPPAPACSSIRAPAMAHSSPVALPRPIDYMHREALDVLPKLLGADRLSSAASSSAIPTAPRSRRSMPAACRTIASAPLR